MIERVGDTTSKKVSAKAKIKLRGSSLRRFARKKEKSGTSNTSSSSSSTNTSSSASSSSSGSGTQASNTQAVARRDRDGVRLSRRASRIMEEEERINNNVDAGNEVNGASPPDFNKMTTQEQYDYLQDVVVQQADGDESAWKTGEGEVNLVGIRSWEDGQPGGREGDAYNDTIYAARMVNGEPRIDSFNASVDGGVWNPSTAQNRGFGYRENGEWKGISHIADGFYRDNWVKGGVPGSDLGLRQAGDIRIHADSNSDGVIQNNERLGADINGDGIGDGVTVGSSWGIQFHPGGNGTNVGQASAGCQVIHGSEYDKFKQIISDAPNSRFSYTLIDSANLPPVGAQHAFDGTPPAQPVDVPPAPVGDTNPPANVPPTNVPPAEGNAPVATPPYTPYTPSTPSTPTAPDSTGGVSQQPAGDVSGTSNTQNMSDTSNPYNASGIPGYEQMMMGMGAMGQQVMMMCLTALQEIEQGVNNGPAVKSLAQWYQMAGKGNMPLPPQIRKLVENVLMKAGIKTGGNAQRTGNTAQTRYNGGHGGMWGASPLQFYR
ncbi:MAG: hypothetical protein K8T10_11805 [Candidatus Eremiobacteraeota bacterium]|nr:hypothetical protein [Candidatus Eremiobacteraeota bacterium]